MKPQALCWSPLLLKKNPLYIRTPIRSRKKRNGFFIVVNILVATKWLLMLGKFETETRILAMKPKGCCRSLLLYQKTPSHTHPDTVTKKRNGFFIVVSTLVATKWLLMLGKFETKARILGMKPQVCWRPFLLSKKSISRPLQEKKAKNCLTFQLLFSKLLFSFFENNVFT